MISRTEAVNVQPADQPNGLPLPLTPTLEAQRDIPTKARGLRQWVILIFAEDDVLDHPAERKLKTAILKSRGDKRTLPNKALETLRGIQEQSRACRAPVSSNVGPFKRVQMVVQYKAGRLLIKHIADVLNYITRLSRCFLSGS